MPFLSDRPNRNLVLAIAALLGLACSDGGSSRGTGTLSVPITDAPFPAHDGCLDEALITIDGVEAKGDGGFYDVALVDPDPDGTVTLDLLALRAGLMDSLAVSGVPTGSISEIRLHILESVLVFEDGRDADFKVPSGGSSGLKIRVDPPALVVAGQTTTLILDFDLAHSFHTRGLGGDPSCDDLKQGEDQVIFSPLVRANNESTDGIILGNVTDAVATPAANIEVCAFVADTDIAVEPEPEPEATTFSAPDGLEGVDEGDYALLLPAGVYDLYLRDLGEEDRSLVLEDVDLSAGESLEGVDLSLP